MRCVSYIVYDRATGEIKRTGQCPEKMLGVQPGAGESVMEGEAGDATHRVQADMTGKKTVITLTAAERKALRARRVSPKPDQSIELKMLYNILARLEQQGYDLGPDGAALAAKAQKPDSNV